MKIEANSVQDRMFIQEVEKAFEARESVEMAGVPYTVVRQSRNDLYNSFKSDDTLGRSFYIECSDYTYELIEVRIAESIKEVVN